MNLNESEIEDRLRALRPAQVSPGLERRIGQAMAALAVIPDASPMAAVAPANVVRPVRWLHSFTWAALGAAASLLALGLWHVGSGGAAYREVVPAPPIPAPAIMEGWQPQGFDAELVAATDEGIVTSADQEPVRQIRYESVERQVWSDPATGAVLEIEIPREDVRFTPVAMQ